MSRDVQILGGIGIITLIIVIFAAFTIGGQSGTQQGQTEVLNESQKELLVRKNSHTDGNPKSKVTVVEFADFQCPACATGHTVMIRIKAEYKDKVRFVYRHFPLTNSHPNANIAALASEASSAQGKFWQMHDKLFENQNEWSGEKDPSGIFAEYAKEIGLDVDKFTQELKAKKYESIVQSDVADANRLGINSTPTFYIGDKKFAGVLPYEDFKKELDALLGSK